MKKLILSISFLLIFNCVVFAGDNQKYINKLLKHKIITQEQLNAGVTIQGSKGNTKIIKKNGKITIKHISKKKLQRNKERELKKKIKENEDRYNELKEEIERLKRRTK